MKYYFIGIKGSGMSALALILDNLGFKVVGYDDSKNHVFTEDELIKRGIKIYSDNSFKISSNDVVVRSSAISDNHKEYLRVKDICKESLEYFQMVGKLTSNYKTITVAGCHGKTTTSRMLSICLNNSVGCNYLIGDGSGYSNPNNDYFVIEACEYKRHFLEYKPYIALITNIDYDHVDYYKNIDDVFDAYQEYARHASNMVIACGDNLYTRKLNVKNIKYYGIDKNNDIIAKNINYNESGTSFDVYIENNYFGKFDSTLYGRHMVLNCLGVIACCYYEGLSYKSIYSSIKLFKGAKRRFNIENINDNVITIDDYAHHPEEIKVTLDSARQKYPDKEIVAVYQPHTYSRTKMFEDEIVYALNLADKAYVMDIYEAREAKCDYAGVSSYNIINKLRNGEHINIYESDKLLIHKDSVIVFMSANDISELRNNLKKKVKSQI